MIHSSKRPQSSFSARFHRLLCCTTPSTSAAVFSPVEPYPVSSLAQALAVPEASDSASSRKHFIPFECPWLQTDTPYDDHPDGFWDFPERAKWVLDGRREHRKFPNEVMDALAPILRDLDEKYACRQRAVPASLLASRPKDGLSIKCFRSDLSVASVGEEVAFLQAWLFFGVLKQAHAILGFAEGDPAAEFVVRDRNGGGTTRTLSTAALDVLPHRWAAALNVLPSETRMERWRELLAVVHHVVTLQTVISTCKPATDEGRTLTYDECRVLLAIRILFRAILLALTLSLPPSLPASDGDLGALQLLLQPALAQAFPADWDELKDYAIDEMRMGGWCPSECELLERFDGAYNFFAARLRGGRLQLDHTRCSDRMCVADQVVEEAYETAHVQEGCRCALVRVKPEELCAVLDRGKVPRVVVSPDLRLSVSEGGAYVAVSHVWAHGLGNPRENALPRCQVQRLANYMTGLKAVGETSSGLWMDSLCIPVCDDLKPYRQKAISLMSQTYREASAVLVLDKELQGLDIATVSQLEQDILTAFVGWTRRLWTLPEAALASRLYVQTLHVPHKLETTAPSPVSPRDSLLAKICFRADIAAFTRSRIPPMASLTRTVFESTDPQHGVFPIETNSTVFQRLALAVQHRTTSKMDDEPHILTIMLALDSAPILGDQNRDARMAALFVLLRDLPSDIVFFGGGLRERCAQAPFRWAPRSLLGFPRIELHASFGAGAVCDERGLHARYQGFVVEHGEGGANQTPLLLSQPRCYAVDTPSGVKYEFRVHEGAVGAGLELPTSAALLFRPYGIGGDTVLAEIIREGESEEDEHQVVVVGHWVMVASGVMLEFAPEVPVLKGALTAGDQRWRVT
ncbi:hypothetical protein C8Q76DRAFT_792572 [Earliella scabrosa]|nr:hypothetical protein C8Q76DRAFT_792572 [Earliella scabrosa]